MGLDFKIRVLNGDSPHYQEVVEDIENYWNADDMHVKVIEPYWPEAYGAFDNYIRARYSDLVNGKSGARLGTIAEMLENSEKDLKIFEEQKKVPCMMTPSLAEFNEEFMEGIKVEIIEFIDYLKAVPDNFTNKQIFAHWY